MASGKTTRRHQAYPTRLPPPSPHRPCSLPDQHLGHKRTRWWTYVGFTGTQPPCPLLVIVSHLGPSGFHDVCARHQALSCLWLLCPAANPMPSTSALLQALLPVLPTPRPQEDEMADVRWFHRDFVAAALAAAEGKAGASYSSIALMGAKGFCFPGKMLQEKAVYVDWHTTYVIAALLGVGRGQGGRLLQQHSF